MNRGIQAFCLLALTSALPACIALPFATPPLALSAGTGVRYGVPKSVAPSPAMFHADVGLKPLQFMRPWQRRRADVGFGYTFETGAGPLRHGLFAEGTVFPITDSVARIGVSAQPRLWFEDGTDKMGFGMAARVTAEVRQFVSTEFSGSTSSGGGAGYAHGEGGIGVYLEGAYASMGDRPNLTLGLGLSGRIPASVGFAIAALR